jgi:copper chaperone CopZ
MRTRILECAVIALSLTTAVSAWACGVCIEDRVAAVYDQPSVSRAVARHQQVVFYGLEGSVQTRPETRKAVIAALEPVGVRGSVRVSLESAAVSVAYDPAKSSPESIAVAGNRALASRGLKLLALRVTGPDGKLREP